MAATLCCAIPAHAASLYQASLLPDPDLMPGSNNFAVAGSLTQDRRAIVAEALWLAGLAGVEAPAGR